MFTEVTGFKIGVYPASEGFRKLAARPFCIFWNIDD